MYFNDHGRHNVHLLRANPRRVRWAGARAVRSDHYLAGGRRRGPEAPPPSPLPASTPALTRAAWRGSADARASSSDPDVAPSQKAVVRVDRSAARAGDPYGEAIRPVAGLGVVLDVGGVLAGGSVPERAVAAEGGAELGAVDRERPDVPGQRQPAAGLVADPAGGR